MDFLSVRAPTMSKKSSTWIFRTTPGCYGRIWGHAAKFLLFHPRTAIACSFRRGRETEISPSSKTFDDGLLQRFAKTLTGVIPNPTAFWRVRNLLFRPAPPLLLFYTPTRSAEVLTTESHLAHEKLPTQEKWGSRLGPGAPRGAFHCQCRFHTDAWGHP